MSGAMSEREMDEFQLWAQEIWAQTMGERGEPLDVMDDPMMHACWHRAWMMSKAKPTKTVENYSVDLLPEEIEERLRPCETRIVMVGEDGAFGAYFRQEILYEGRWRKVGRTSLMDDVATGLCAFKKEDTMTLSKLLSGHYLGARVHDDYISIITHYTDG